MRDNDRLERERESARERERDCVLCGIEVHNIQI